MPKEKQGRSRGPGRLTATETALLEARLLDSAQAVFIEAGYAGATMDEIARRALTGRKTLYARYANKGEVLTAVVNRLLSTAMAPHHQQRRTARGRRDARSLLLQIARELASLSEAPSVAGLNRLIFGEALQAPDLARLFLDLHARAADDVNTELQQLHDQGALPRLPDSRWAAMIFIEMTASIPRLRALLGVPLSQKETDELTAVAVGMFMYGCGTPARPRAERSATHPEGRR